MHFSPSKFVKAMLLTHNPSLNFICYNWCDVCLIYQVVCTWPVDKGMPVTCSTYQTDLMCKLAALLCHHKCCIETHYVI